MLSVLLPALAAHAFACRRISLFAPRLHRRSASCANQTHPSCSSRCLYARLLLRLPSPTPRRPFLRLTSPACRTRTIASRSSCLSVSQYPTSRIRTAHSASSTAQSKTS